MPRQNNASRKLARARECILGSDEGASSSFQDSLESHLALLVKDIAELNRNQEEMKHVFKQNISELRADLERLGKQETREYEFVSSMGERVDLLELMMAGIHSASTQSEVTGSLERLESMMKGISHATSPESENEDPYNSEDEGYTPRDLDDLDEEDQENQQGNTENNENGKENEQDDDQTDMTDSENGEGDEDNQEKTGNPSQPTTQMTRRWS